MKKLLWFQMVWMLAMPVSLWSQKHPDVQQRKAWEDFNKKHGNKWQIRWEEQTGTPGTINGHRTVPDPNIKNSGGGSMLHSRFLII